MNLNGVRTLVTGGAGFVGANLVRELLDGGSTVHVATRSETDLWRLIDILPRVQRHELDLTEAASVRRIVHEVDPDAIFHLAKHRVDPAALNYRAAYAANLGATLNLLEAAVGSTRLRRFVHAGSSLEYDLRRSPLREDARPGPVTVHGVTKAAATILCQHFHVRHGVPTVVLRLFTVYGPWEGAARLVPSVMMAALDEQSVRLTRPGLRHDWIYVGDVVDACVHAVSAGGIDGEILNIGTGIETTNEDVVRLVEELHGAPVGREGAAFPERPWDVGSWVADTSKAERLLGWRASTPLCEGLARTLTWFTQHLDLYRGRVS